MAAPLAPPIASNPSAASAQPGAASAQPGAASAQPSEASAQRAAPAQPAASAQTAASPAHSTAPPHSAERTPPQATPPHAMFVDTSSAEGSRPLRFAVVGSFGTDSRTERSVAELIRSWEVDLVITTGDNRIGRTYQESVGQDKYYCDLIVGGGSGCPSHHFRSLEGRSFGERSFGEWSSLGTNSLGTASLGTNSLGTASSGPAALGTASLGTASLGTASLGTASLATENDPDASTPAAWVGGARPPPHPHPSHRLLSRGDREHHRNRFFPTPGARDYTGKGGIGAYTEYFELPGAGESRGFFGSSQRGGSSSNSELYYDFVAGNVSIPPFSPYVAPRSPHMSEIHSCFSLGPLLRPRH